MTQEIHIGSLRCLCAATPGSGSITYILYPTDILDDWIAEAAERFSTSIVVITGMDWQNALSPWPAKGVPRGCPDFKGEAPLFLSTMQQTVIPRVEAAMGLPGDVVRSLVGVSLSGLFALWQWMISDTFVNIASLSGSFWYDGFVDRIKNRPVMRKDGAGYFLLGRQETSSKVKIFQNVERDTQEIVDLLRAAGITTEFEIVEGGHYSNPLQRLERAMTYLSRSISS